MSFDDTYLHIVTCVQILSVATFRVFEIFINNSRLSSHLVKCFMSICNTRDPRRKTRSIDIPTPPPANHIIDPTSRITSAIKNTLDI